MSNVIEFQSPAQLRKLLAEREEEIAALKAQITAVTSVKEMLHIQALDLQEQVEGLVKQMTLVQKNLGNLLKKLNS